MIYYLMIYYFPQTTKRLIPQTTNLFSNLFDERQNVLPIYPLIVNAVHLLTYQEDTQSAYLTVFDRERGVGFLLRSFSRRSKTKII